MGVAAVLLAVGVLALTIFFSGGPPRPVSDRAGPAPSAGSRDDPAATGPTTRRPAPTTGGVADPAGGTHGSGDGPGVGGATPHPVAFSTGPQLGGPSAELGPGGTVPGVTASGSAATVAPLPGVAQGEGWWVRSEAGRAHGRALGLLTNPGHGCQREVSGRGRAAHARPAGCP